VFLDMGPEIMQNSSKANFHPAILPEKAHISKPFLVRCNDFGAPEFGF
jgi:hypothetical protein